MRLLILGNTPEAVWLTARLHSSTHDVVWCSQSAAADASVTVPTFPLTIQQGSTSVTIESLPMLDDLDAALNPLPDWVIFATTGWALGEVAYALIQRISPSKFPKFLCLAHGIGPTEKLANFFGQERVVRGVMAAHMLWGTNDTGVDTSHIIIKGELGLVVATHDLNPLMDSFLGADIWGATTRFADDEALKWSDVLRLLPGNALATLMDIDPRAIPARRDLWSMEVSQLQEAVKVIRTRSIDLVALPGVNVPILARWIWVLPAFLLKFVLARYFPIPTLKEDFRINSGRSDAAYLNGAVAQAAQGLKFSTPVNHALAMTVTDAAEGRALWEQIRNDATYLPAIIRIMSRH